MKRLKYIIFGALCALPLVMTTSCSDEPDKDNFYTFWINFFTHDIYKVSKGK